MYTGKPLCVFSSNPKILLVACDWFTETFHLEGKKSLAGATNFVLGDADNWRYGVSLGSEKHAEEAEEWLANSTICKTGMSSDYIFINLDEEIR